MRKEEQVVAGPLPFREAYPDFAARSRSKKNMAENWNVFHGWREKPVKPEMRKLVSSLGNYYEMPGEDLDKFLRYVRHDSEVSQEYSEADRKALKNVQTPADYIDFVFDAQRLKRLKRKQVVDMPAANGGDGGHIVHLTYNTRYMLLKVTFKNGTVCCFFNVPERAVRLLMYHAENGTMAAPGPNGRRRHALGVEFWNLIRIRGTVHQTRYPFEYVVDNNAGPRDPSENKYEYTTGWSDRLQREVQLRIPKEHPSDDEDSSSIEADTKLKSEIDRQEKVADAQDVVYDYEQEDLVTFFENGCYDEMIGKANSMQRKLLIQAESAYNADKDIGDIENLLRKTGMFFPQVSELHAKYD